MSERILLVTGKLAAEPITRLARELSNTLSIPIDVHIAKISVAALMTAEWLTGKITLPPDTTRVILPGLCRGNPQALSESLGGVPVVLGPEDFRDLPEFFSQPQAAVDPLASHSIEILSEINHANRLSLDDLLKRAQALRAAGADIIDLGATPSEPWRDVARAVEHLRANDLRVSIDSFDPREVTESTSAGAELVLSVNSSNLAAARDWNAEVVLLPDDHHAPDWLANIKANSQRLADMGVKHRLDPILDPIGFGFAPALARYIELRRAMPKASLLMGVGNLTELTEVDSAGVNMVLIGLCQELDIQSVLTTEVIPWARTSTAEINIARRLMYYAVTNQRLPKHVGGKLLLLRDPKLKTRGTQELARLQKELRDPNFRLFAEEGKIIAMNGQLLDADTDPFALFDRLGVEDPAHAFYLGWEMMKGAIALQLGKQYTQDRALRWGFLTQEEESHKSKRQPSQADEKS